MDFIEPGEADRIVDRTARPVKLPYCSGGQQRWDSSHQLLDSAPLPSRVQFPLPNTLLGNYYS